MGVTTVSFLVPGGRAAATAARHWVLLAGGNMSRDVRDNLALLLSEMVNNAVQHGGASESERIQVRLSWPSRRLRVEVLDPGNPRPESIERVTREGGWGLVLVDSLADRWGLDSAPEGGSVAWFELTLGGRHN